MPTGSMKKYFEDRGGDASAHGGPLSWPGTPAGFPFRGSVPDLRQEEYDTIPHVLDYHSQLFRLWDLEEKRAWDQVMDRIMNGWYMEHRRIDRWSDQHCGLVVWLEWVQIYGEAPTTKAPTYHGDTYEAAPAGQSFGTPEPRISHQGWDVDPLFADPRISRNRPGPAET